MSTLNNDVYFLCGMESFKELIGLIEHIDLPLRVRYQFCMAPVSVKSIFLSTLFTKVFTNQLNISLLFTFDKLMICFHLLNCCYRGTVSCVSHIAHEPLAFCCQRWNCLHLLFPKDVRYLFKDIVLKFARSYSNGTPIDCKWLLLQTDYPWSLPKTIKSLAKLEEVHEIMDMYLWLR